MYKSHNPHLRQTQGVDIFRSGYSCQAQLIVTPHGLLRFFDQTKQVDFSKAFANFLTQRKMCVVIEGELMLHLELYKEHRVATAAIPERVNSEI